MIVLSLFSPIAWVRKIETFKVGFMFAFVMIIVTLITISAFCVSINLGESKGTGNSQDAFSEAALTERGFVPINYDSFWNMIGFSFFMFEGIGGVMPLMSATRDRDQFAAILSLALGFLTVVYILFATLCYYTFGKSLDKAIIMEMMPSDNPII